MFVIQISLLIVTFHSLHHEFCHYCKPPKKSTHTLGFHHVSICGVSPSYSYFYSYATYATSLGKVKWSGPHQQRWEENEFKFHSVTCYTNYIVSRIHVNTTKLHNRTCPKSMAMFMVSTNHMMRGNKYNCVVHKSSQFQSTIQLYIYTNSLIPLCGTLEYNRGLFKKLRKEIQIWSDWTPNDLIVVLWGSTSMHNVM